MLRKIRNVPNDIRYYFNIPTKPNWLLLNVTWRCNSRCKTCSIWKTKIDKNSEMSVSDYQKLFSDHFLSKVQVLSLSGGEPTLRSDLVEIAEAGIETLPNLKRVTLNTNCILANHVKKFLDAVTRRMFVSLIFSIDGVGDAHDEIRGVQGNWASLLQVVNYAQKLNNIHVAGSVVVSPWNINHIDEVFHWLRKHKIYISWSYMRNDKFFRHDKTYPRIHDPRIKHIQNPCFALFNRAHIDPYGNIFGCVVKCDEIGNIRESSFSEVWESGEAWKWRKQHRHCHNCREWSCECNFNLAWKKQSFFWNG